MTMTMTDTAPLFRISGHSDRKELWRLERASVALPAKWILAGVYHPATDNRTLEHHAGANARFLPDMTAIMRGLTSRRRMVEARAEQGIVKSPVIEQLSKDVMAQFERAVEIVWFPASARMNQELDWAFGLCDVLAEID